MRRTNQLSILGIVVFLILLAETLVFNRLYLVQHFSGLEQRRLRVEDGVLNQLSYQGGILMAQGINPRIKFENINIRVMAVAIQCVNSGTNVVARVFYRSNEKPFNELNSMPYQPRRNGREIILSLPKTQFVSDLRIDVSNQKGDTIICRELVINPYSQFRLTLARLTLYLWLIALAILENFKFGDDGYQNRSARLFNFLHLGANLPFKLSRMAVLWILLWWLPWAVWLDALPWLRSGLSLLLFITPGMILSLLVARHRFSLPGLFSIGSAISVLLVGALGFIGRIFHWSFEYIKILFIVSGLIALLALLRLSTSEQPWYKPARFSRRTIILLLFMIVFGILANIPSQHSTDDFSFVAYLTSWQHAQHLDFREVFYGTGTADSLRFWFGMFPMSLALLAEISHIHGLLLMTIYLEPLLIVVAILTTYALYEDLLSSQDQAITATLLQFTFFFLLRKTYQPGFMFFERPSDDKVFAAFILAPVFFLALRYFLDSFHWRSGLLFFLCGSSLALTHPIVLAYSVFIAGIWAAIETIIRKEYVKLALITFLLVLIMTPSASLRFIDDVWISRAILGLEPSTDVQDVFSLDTARADSATVDTLVSPIEGTPFYGFDLDRVRIEPTTIPEHPLTVFLSWSYLWILGIGFLWSLFNLKRNAAAPFTAAASLLVLLSAIPYTGWLLGYFVSARMLWRTPWLLPIGLISFFLLRELSSAAGKYISTHPQFRIKPKDVLHIWVPVACLILMTGLSEFIYQYQGLQKGYLEDYRDHLRMLAELGYYIDSHVDEPARFVARPGLMPYLPGLSAKAKVVVFRLKEWAPYPIDENEISSLISRDPSISMEQRIQILEKYNIQYILGEDAILKDYYISSPNLFSAQNMSYYWLVKFNKRN